MVEHFDIIVIGGGHAGVEAAWAASHMLAAADAGSSAVRKVALLTMDPLAIGRMSCNPAIGGLAKGQMVREIDALGGLMAHAIDYSGIQFRMLNRSKGPAVQSPRAQADKYLYAATVQRLLGLGCPNLSIIAGIVDRLHVDEAGAIAGVTLEDGRSLSCGALVLTTGTFLRALMHTGEQKTEGGRVGEQSARGLSTNLKELGFELGRLKTGTPPRLARESIDFSSLAEQPGDVPPLPFSDLTGTNHSPLLALAAEDARLRSQDSSLKTVFPFSPQVACHITFTTPAVHDLIRANLHRAPMYSGQIGARGPRYCPSIEDKVVRFADKTAHQIFLEPEGLHTNEIYCNGISTSLPRDVQEAIIHQIAGLENAKILRWGYAVEYDFSPTHQIDATLETKRIRGLFFAGQLNGTSGYEEAAGQGLIAGINATRRVLGESPIVLTRDQAYIGVMIDDLVTKTPTEPYRMFTSRAEFRLTLRNDNTDQRLTALGHSIGLASDARLALVARKQRALREVVSTLHATRLDAQTTAYEFLRRPETGWSDLIARLPVGGGAGAAAALEKVSEPIQTQAQIEIKYSGYIERENRAAARLRSLEEKRIPTSLDYAGMRELRNEAREAMTRFRPQTIGQASRLEGITPSDLTIVMLYLEGGRGRVGA